MIKAWIQKGKIIAQVEKSLKEMEWSIDPDQIPKHVADRIKYEMGSRLVTKVIESITYKYNEKLIDELANTYIANFDFKKAVEDGLRDKIKNFIGGNYR